MIPEKLSSGRHNAVYGTNFNALGFVMIPLALHTLIGVYHIDIPFGDRTCRTLGKTDSTGHAVLGNL